MSQPIEPIGQRHSLLPPPPIRQIDAEFNLVLAEAAEKAAKKAADSQVSRKSDLGDSIMTAIVIAPLAQAPCAFTELGVLRLQECSQISQPRSPGPHLPHLPAETLSHFLDPFVPESPDPAFPTSPTPGVREGGGTAR